MKTHTLEKIPIGTKVIIDSISDKESDKQRLIDLGFNEGNEISPIFSAVISNDPRGYLINGAVISIRNIQATNINVLLYGCDENA